MKTYNVVFRYLVEVEADDEEQAEDNAYALFTEQIKYGLGSDYFPATVEEKE